MAEFPEASISVTKLRIKWFLAVINLASVLSSITGLTNFETSEEEILSRHNIENAHPKLTASPRSLQDCMSVKAG